MPCYSEICPLVVTFVTAQPIPINFVRVSLKWLHMSFGDSECHTLHSTASNGPVWPDLVNGDKVRSRKCGMNDLGLIEAELRNLGLRYQIMAGMAL